jgi:putative ABC transport system permease protein
VNGRRVPVAADHSSAGPFELQVKGILADKALASRDDGRMLIGSVALARRLAPLRRTIYQVNRQAGADPDQLRRNLQRDFQVIDDRSALLGERADERAFRNGIKVLGGLALVLGMLVVFQTLSQSLLERLRQIGLMRCLGTSRGSVGTIFLVDAVLLAVVGSILGSGGGILLAWVMGEMHWTTLGLGKQITSFEVPWTPVCLAAALGILFTVAGAAFPLIKARNLPPMQVLQARGLGDAGYLLRGVNIFLFVLLVGFLPLAYLAMTPLLAAEGSEMRVVLMQLFGMVLVFGVILLITPRLVQGLGGVLIRPLAGRLPLPVFLVEKSLQRGAGRFAATVCGLSVVLVAMVALKHITYALHGEVRSFSAAAMTNRWFLWAKDAPVTTDQARAVEQVPGVLAADLFVGEARAPFPLSGLPVADLTRPGGLFASQPNKARAYTGSRTLIISRRWAKLRFVATEGTPVDVLTDAGTKRYTVLAITDSAGFFPDERAWAVAAPRWLRTDFCVTEPAVRRVALHVAPGADVAAVRAQVNHRFPHQRFKTGNEISGYLVWDVANDFLLFDVLLFLTLVLVGVGLVNTMTIAALGRAREIGVLRALGMSERRLKQSFLMEGLVVAGLATLVALALALPTGYVVVLGLNRVAGLEAPFLVPWFYLALVPVLAVLTGLIAATVPGSRAVEIRPADAVRYE